MYKILTIALLTLALSSCSWFYPRKLDIQQGNLITQDMLSLLKKGQTKEQVQHIMGTPVHDNIFDDEHWSYVHTFKPGRGEMTVKRTTIIFRKDKVVKIIS